MCCCHTRATKRSSSIGIARPSPSLWLPLCLLDEDGYYYYTAVRPYRTPLVWMRAVLYAAVKSRKSGVTASSSRFTYILNCVLSLLCWLHLHACFHLSFFLLVRANCLLRSALLAFVRSFARSLTALAWFRLILSCFFLVLGTYSLFRFYRSRWILDIRTRLAADKVFVVVLVQRDFPHALSRWYFIFWFFQIYWSCRSWYRWPQSTRYTWALVVRPLGALRLLSATTTPRQQRLRSNTQQETV